MGKASQSEQAERINAALALIEQVGAPAEVHVSGYPSVKLIATFNKLSCTGREC
jgi:hypothetical protein